MGGFKKRPKRKRSIKYKKTYWGFGRYCTVYMKNYWFTNGTPLKHYIQWNMADKIQELEDHCILNGIKF